MHEFSFAQQVLESVEREAAAYPGSKVLRVKLRAGELLALEPSSLRFCLESIAVGTVMENAIIEMDEFEPEVECPKCGRVPVQSVLESKCPICGEPALLVAGTELIIEEIELDDQKDTA
jgi:hydrogenase nickel incorporation protein HypA/HybF